MTTADGKSERNVFAVDLGGLQLPREAAERIARAVQKAVLTEIATLDLSPGFNTSFVPPEGLGGPTQGIWIQPAER